MRPFFMVTVAVVVLSAGAWAAPPLGPHRAVPDGGHPDAGVADAGEPPADPAKESAAKAAAQQAELDQLREQVAALRERTAVLEDRLSRIDGLTQQLGQLVSKVEGLRNEVADAEATRQSERQDAARHAADVRGAIEGLMWAESQLSSGGTDVGSQLDRAQSVLNTPQAAYDLQSARAALANKDLLGARLWLYQAILDSQQGH